jgi:hypothetical protein
VQRSRSRALWSVRSDSYERDKGRIRTYIYIRGAEDSKRRKGNRHGNRPPVSRGGESSSPKEAPQESTVAGGFQKLTFWSSWISFAPTISRLTRARLDT